MSTKEMNTLTIKDAVYEVVDASARKSISQMQNQFHIDSIEPTENDIPKIFFQKAIPQSKTDIVTAFRYISKTQDISGYAKFKAQGTSSMSYPKKNMTVKMYADEACTEKLEIDFKGWGEQNTHCYKANWIDISHARNVVSARLWGDVVKTRSNYSSLPEELRTSPNQGAIDGFPVKVYSQGIYQGRYTLNIPKDAWMANMDDSLDSHCILCGENYVSGCFRSAANINGSDWSDEVHSTVPNSIKTRWNEVISFVMNSTDEEFVANLENYFFVDSLIDYYIFGLVSCGLDAFGKNQLYFTYDGNKWIASMYDMDSTWGLYWNGSRILASNYARTSYEDYVNSTGNLLYVRLEQLFTERIKERYAELKKGVLSVENIINCFERFTDIASLDLIKEDYASTTGGGSFTGIPSQTTNNIQQIRKFVIERYTYCDEYIAGLTSSEPTPDEPDIPVEPEEPSGIVWSETAEYNIDSSTGEVVSGDAYVSEPFSVESGYVYELATPTGGSWNTVFVYDSNGNFKYFKGNPGSTGGKGTLYFDGFENQLIRLSVCKESDELDLSTIVPVKTDRIWSIEKYVHRNGVWSYNNFNNYITLQKIPVEANAIYKLSTSGTHQYLSWYEYTEDGVYLGYKGDVAEPKELEAIVSTATAYVILSMYGGELPCDEYVTFVKTADAVIDDEVTEYPTGLVYELAEPMTFNGSSDFVDTGVKLYEADKDFEILLEFEEGNYDDSLATILHCMYEETPWHGMTLYHLNGGDLTLVVNFSNRKDIIVSDNGVTRLAIAKIGNYYCVKLMHNGLAEPQLLAEFNTAYSKVDNSLLIGAYQDTNGNKGRFWNGTISKCKVYIGDLPTDMETNAFLMGMDNSSNTPDFTLTEGFYDDNGALTTQAGYSMHHTDYIPITDGYIVTTMPDEDGYTNDPFLRISYFDAEFNHLGYDRGFGLNVAKQNYHCFVRLDPTIENVAYYAVNINTSDSSLISYSETAPNIGVDSLEESEWNEGYYNDAGTIITYENMHHSSLMSISECIVSAGGDRNLRISYFDETGKYICYDRGYGVNTAPPNWISPTNIVVLTTIENAVYFAINANTTDKSIVTVRDIDSKEVVESFDESVWIPGYYDDLHDGNIYIDSNLNMHHSMLIPISYTAVSTDVDYLRIVYFDSNKNYLGFDRGFGFNVANNNEHKSLITVNTTVENAAYFAICANTIDKSLITVKDNIVVTDTFESATWSVGHYDDDGSIADPFYNMHHSSYMPITEGVVTTTMSQSSSWTQNPMLRITYFDENFVTLGYDKGAGLNVATNDYYSEITINTTLENVAYFAVSANTADKSLISVTVSE